MNFDHTEILDPAMRRFSDLSTFAKIVASPQPLRYIRALLLGEEPWGDLKSRREQKLEVILARYRFGNGAFEATNAWEAPEPDDRHRYQLRGVYRYADGQSDAVLSVHFWRGSPSVMDVYAVEEGTERYIGGLMAASILNTRRIAKAEQHLSASQIPMTPFIAKSHWDVEAENEDHLFLRGTLRNYRSRDWDARYRVQFKEGTDQIFSSSITTWPGGGTILSRARLTDWEPGE